MKAYKKLAIQVLQLEEDVIADSGGRSERI